MEWAPNGDLFAAQSRAGIILVMRGGNPDMRSEFATGLQNPFGLAFQNGYLYVGETTRMVRFKYQPGETKASGTATASSHPASGIRSASLCSRAPTRSGRR